MDETGVSIVAQVAGKEAAEMVRQGIPPTPENLAAFDGWYTHFGQKVIGTVKQAMAAQQPVTAAPPVGQPQNEWDRPQGPAQQPQNGAPAAPSCPQHGPMVPGPGQTKGKGPLWKCNQAKWDFNTKSEVGCTYVIWPQDAAVV